MVYDLNSLEYQKELADAGNSKDGKIIVEFLKKELSLIKYDDIDDKLSFDQIGLEYKVVTRIKKVLNKCLSYLTK